MGEGVESEHGVLLALRVKSGCERRRKLSRLDVCEVRECLIILGQKDLTMIKCQKEEITRVGQGEEYKREKA